MTQVSNDTLQVRVLLKNDETKTSSGILQITHWDTRQRFVRALKMGGLFWGLALVSILIPLAHFVLVPGFFLVGPVVAHYYYHLESMITGGKAHCPGCSKEFEIAKSRNEFPISDLCNHCQSAVIIEN